MASSTYRLLIRMRNLVFHVSCLFSLFLQEVPEKSKESEGTPWQFVGLLPIFDPPRHDSAETIRRALHLGVNVKMITGAYPFSSNHKILITIVSSL